jgi:hypothetical protein
MHQNDLQSMLQVIRGIIDMLSGLIIPITVMNW